jgi:hypothetical protein
LLLGLGTERASVAVMNLVGEWVPRRRAIPVLAPLVICLCGEGLLQADAVSFAGIFNAAGIAANVVLGLVLAPLLLEASRRTGDLTPGVLVPLAGRRATAAALIAGGTLLLVALATVLATGLLLRVVALAALGALVSLVWLARRDRPTARR